jgi:hypothetical protein
MSVYPVRYYIIDFEFSIRFPEDSTPDQRLVTGLPILRNGYDHPDDYGRDIAPEMLLDKPHCPFKSDIFQLGKMFLLHFHASRSGICLAGCVTDAATASGDRLS